MRFQREARKLLSSDDARSLARALPRGAPLLARVHRPADRAAGRRRLVRRPAPDVELPRALPDRVLRQPRDARAARPPEVADGPGRLAPLRRGAHRAVAGPAAARHAGAGRSRATPTTSRSRATGDPERFDHVILATHSDQALKLLADPTDREHELLGAIPYQPNEAVLHTDRTLLPRRRRAWASWNYHLLDEPTGKPTVTYHMNRLQSLDAEREFCVTLNHTDAIDPDKVIRTIPYAHPVYTAQGQAAQAAPPRDQRPEPHALLRRLLGLGLPRGRRRRAASASPSPWERSRCEPRARSTRATSATAASRCGIMSSATGSRWPTSTSTSSRRCSAAGSPAAARASCASAAATTSAIRARRSPTPSARCVEQRPRRTAPQGPIRLLTHLRTLRPLLQPGQLLLLLRARRRDARGDRRRGHQHAVGRAPRLRAPAGAQPAAVRQGAARLALHADGPALHVAARPRPARRSPSTSRAAQDGARAFDATLGLKRRPLTRRALAAPPRARRSACSRSSTATRVALKLKGVPVQPHPAR